MLHWNKRHWLDKGLPRFEWVSNWRAKSTNRSPPTSKNPGERENSPTDHPIRLIAVCVLCMCCVCVCVKGRKSPRNLSSPGFFAAAQHWSGALITAQTNSMLCLFGNCDFQPHLAYSYPPRQLINHSITGTRRHNGFLQPFVFVPWWRENAPPLKSQDISSAALLCWKRNKTERRAGRKRDATAKLTSVAHMLAAPPPLHLWNSHLQARVIIIIVTKYSNTVTPQF